MIELCRHTFLHIMPAAISCVAEKNSARLLHLSRNEIRNRALLSIQCVEKKETITLLNLAEPLSWLSQTTRPSQFQVIRAILQDNC